KYKNYRSALLLHPRLFADLFGCGDKKSTPAHNDHAKAESIPAYHYMRKKINVFYFNNKINSHCDRQANQKLLERIDPVKDWKFPFLGYFLRFHFKKLVIQ